MKRFLKLLSFVLIVSILCSFWSRSTLAVTLKISNIKNLSASVYEKQSYVLPNKVTATMSNKKTQTVAITWSPKTAVTSKAGTFVYKGTVKGYAKQVLLTLKVIPIPAVKPRVVVNGKVNEVKGYEMNGELYFKPQDIVQVMSGSNKPFTTAMIAKKTITAASVTVEKVNYIKMSDIAKAMNFSYTHDTVLGAAYIWTDLDYDASARGDAQEVKEEIARAKKLGFVPLALQNDLSKQITFKEFCQMLRIVVNTNNSKLVPKWDTLSKKAAASNSAMTRGDGMLAILEAAVVMGQNEFNADWGIINSKIGEKGWDEFSNRNETLFTNLQAKKAVKDNPEFDYWAASYFFSFGRQSMVTNKTLFDYDNVANSMHSDKAFTREDAIKAVIRLFESINTEKMIPLSDSKAVTYDETIITDKLLSKADELPKVTLDNLPYWTGFTYGLCYRNELFTRFKQSDIQNMGNWGFNSVRIYMDYRDIFSEDVSKVNLNALQKLDRLISYGMKYNVHISISFPSSPGWWTGMQSSTFKYEGSLDFFTNEEHQRQAQNMWKCLAERYKSIPNSILSFDPIFEPDNYTRSTGNDIVSNKNYTAKDIADGIVGLVKAIKSVSPERLVIFEGIGTTDLKVEPFEVAARKEGALLMANYGSLPFIYWNWNIYGTDDRVHSGFLPDWPMTSYNVQTEIYGEYYSNEATRNTPLMVKGELVKGTKFDLYITKVSGSGTLVVTADGKEICREDIDPQVGKDGCVSKEYEEDYSYRTDDPFSYPWPHAKSDKEITFSLDNNVKELKIAFTGSDSKWIRWSEMDVTLPERYSVERWWYETGYDAHINGTESGEFKRKTAQIIIDPIGNAIGSTINIHPDVTFSTENVAERLDQKFLNDWMEEKIKLNNGDPLILRFEPAFSGKVGENQIKYYDDMLSVFQSHKVSWFNNDFYTITTGEGGSYAGDKIVQYGDYNAFDVTLLKVLQKHQ